MKYYIYNIYLFASSKYNSKFRYIYKKIEGFKRLFIIEDLQAQFISHKTQRVGGVS